MNFLRPHPTLGRTPWPCVAAKALIEDMDGNRFLDFTAGIAVCAAGHCHPRIVAAVERQARRLIHMSGTDFYYEPQQQLAQKLSELAPCGAPGGRVFFTNSGAESVEAALKLVRHHTGRPRMLAFWGGFHGRTMGALSLTASKAVQRQGFFPLLPGVDHFHYPDRQHGLQGLDDMENALRRTIPPGEVAAVFVEPVQGEGGYIVPPQEFWNRLDEIIRPHGILLVTDEVQSGMGRTGKMFAGEHWGLEPDVICLAKGLASGMPLGAIVARPGLMTWPPGSHASTFGGNPISCAAALETIRLLEEELIDNSAARGSQLIELLKRRVGRVSGVGEIRGLGLMVGVELNRPDGSPDSERVERVIQEAFQHGLLLLSCGRGAIRFCPPLIIDAEQIESGVEIFSAALQRQSPSVQCEKTP